MHIQKWDVQHLSNFPKTSTTKDEDQRRLIYRRFNEILYKVTIIRLTCKGHEFLKRPKPSSNVIQKEWNWLKQFNNIICYVSWTSHYYGQKKKVPAGKYSISE